MNRNASLTVVECSILLALALLIAAISVPALVRNRQKKQTAACAMNLERLSAACRRYAEEKGASPAEFGRLVPTYLETVPSCPAGGVYSPGTPDPGLPVCSLHGRPY